MTTKNCLPNVNAPVQLQPLETFDQKIRIETVENNQVVVFPTHFKQYQSKYILDQIGSFPPIPTHPKPN